VGIGAPDRTVRRGRRTGFGRSRGVPVGDDAGVLLDCFDVDTAVASLAAGAGVRPVRVCSVIDGMTGDLLHEERILVESVSKALGVDLARRFTTVRYFHGTRTLRPESFWERGLLPAQEALEDLWRDLREAADGALDADGFDRLRRFIEDGGGGHFGRLYRHKHRDPDQQGPDGLLVREQLERPRGNAHHFLHTPELVDDIANVASDEFGVDLLEPFTRAAVPCIIAFDIPREDATSPVAGACDYVWHAARGDLPQLSIGGFSGLGGAVRPDAIRQVDVVAER
jgi:hypothetical protein